MKDLSSQLLSEMETLPEEIQGEIIQRVPRSNLLEVSQVCSLWKKLALKRVVISDTKKKIRMLCLESDFLSLTYTREISPHNLPHDLLLKYFAEAGNAKMVSRLYGISTEEYGPGEEHAHYNYWPIDYVLMGAGRGGHLELAKWAVSWGALRCELPSEEIGKGGHWNIIQWFIDDCSERRLVQGLCSGGHLEILKWIRDKIPFEPCSYSACKNHHLPVVHWLIQEELFDFDEGLLGAEDGGHQDLIKLLKG